MMNGFVSFQWAEDGTHVSVWVKLQLKIIHEIILKFIQSFRIISIIYCAFGMAVGLAAFLKIGGVLSNMVLFIVLWFVNAAFVLIYLVSQVVLVLIALDDRWSLGKICFKDQCFTF